MKLIANIKLLPTKEQFSTLQQTLETCNNACNWLSDVAWTNKAFGQYALHNVSYYKCRKAFNLAAQVVVRSIAKVADAYRTGAKTKRRFGKHSAQPYDDRIFRFMSDDRVSIWTVDGRQKIKFVCGERQRKLLGFRKGEVDLMFIRGNWYIACVCDIPDPEKIRIDDVLGVDFGIVNLAVDSDGKTFSGSSVDEVRRKYTHRRKNLQRKRTRAAKRKLRKIGNKEARFRRHTNHEVSRAIVDEAQRSRRAIALEDLKGIRKRVKARRHQRARLHSWGFHQLSQFITYKAALVGIPVILVDPRHTSQACPECGVIDKRNRPSRDHFVCRTCGYAEAADYVAARNIRARAVVNQPEGACSRVSSGHSSHRSPLKAVSLNQQ